MSASKEQYLKKKRRLRRKRVIRSSVIGTSEKPRLTVFRSHKHIYCQIIDDYGKRTLASCSTLSKDWSERGKSFAGNCVAAVAIGKVIARKALEAGVTSVQFDRNGYRYLGRIKALADAAREGGLKF